MGDRPDLDAIRRRVEITSQAIAEGDDFSNMNWRAVEADFLALLAECGRLRGALTDLSVRLAEKDATLQSMASEQSGEDKARLLGKAEGVRLAQSFLDELRREALGGGS